VQDNFRGEDYTKLKSTISLIVTDFPIFKDTADYNEHILFRRKNGKIFTNAQQFYIIDLTKIKAEIAAPICLWGRLFKVETEAELKMLMEESDEMKEAGEKLLELSADEEEAREIARIRKTSQWALKHMLHATEERGREEERARAEVEKAELLIENAKKMVKDNLPVEMIKRYTGLSEGEIKQLLP